MTSAPGPGSSSPIVKMGWKVYATPSVLRVIGLGFASGLPFLLVFSTLSARLFEAGLSFSEIGWFSLAGSAYVFKFAWAPLLDAIRIPGLTGLLGRRRAWLVISQVTVAIAILGLGATDPGLDLPTAALWAVLLAFASATQDVAADAYRIESLEPDQQGPGAAAFVNGYRIGVLAAGAGALVIADSWGWFQAYAVMASLMVVGLVTTLTAPEKRQDPHDPALTFGSRLTNTVVSPFLDFFGRPYAILILVFIALFQFGEGLLGLMAIPFYLDIGFSPTEVGYVTKGWGLVMTLTGAFVGGWLTIKVGLMRALLIAGCLQAVGNLAFSGLAMVGPHLAALAITIAIENLTGAMAISAFVAYLSGMTNVAFTAGQYALLSADAALGRKIFAAGGGELAERVDWVVYFGITALAAIPALLLLFWIIRRAPVVEPSGQPQAE